VTHPRARLFPRHISNSPHSCTTIKPTPVFEIFCSIFALVAVDLPKRLLLRFAVLRRATTSIGDIEILGDVAVRDGEAVPAECGSGACDGGGSVSVHGC
jgi:hypothetical protein